MNNNDVTSVLRDIGTRCRDSEMGYRTSAQDTQDFELKSQFERLAQERAEMADEIDRLLRARGAEPAPRGSVLGASHRRFVNLKAALSRNDRQSVMEEVARGESAAEAAYDAALRQTLPDDIRQEIQRQHDRVRETRNRYRAMSGTGEGMATRTTEAVSSFVQERPVLSGTLITFGLGLIAGAVFMSLGARRHAHANYDRHRNTGRSRHRQGYSSDFGGARSRGWDEEGGPNVRSRSGDYGSDYAPNRADTSARYGSSGGSHASTGGSGAASTGSSPTERGPEKS